MFTVIEEKDNYQQMNFVLFVCATESVSSVFLKPPVYPRIRQNHACSATRLFLTPPDYSILRPFFYSVDF